MDWDILIRAPVAIILLYVFVVASAPLVEVLRGTIAFSRNAGFVVGMVELISLIIAAGIIFALLRSFRQPKKEYVGGY